MPILVSPRSDRRRTSTPSSQRSRTVVSGHVEGPSSPSPTRPRSRCPVAAAAGCISWPVRAKQWHAASCKEFNTGDEAEMCASWARMGECSKNPLFMHRSASTEWFDFPGPSRTRPRPEAALGSALTSELVRYSQEGNLRRDVQELQHASGRGSGLHGRSVRWRLEASEESKKRQAEAGCARVHCERRGA